MQIATWNVNSIRTRQQQVLDWLADNPVDVLCLQETKVSDGEFPQQPFRDRGYYLYISGQKSYNGVAMVARSPLEEVTLGFAPGVGEAVAGEFDDQKRVISGVIGDVRVVNLYVPNGASVGSEKYDYKLRWLGVLRQYLAALLEKSPGELCVCGDFNIAPEDRDIHNPKGKESHVMASPAEREALGNILTLGLRDGFRKFTDETGHYSWWDYRTGGLKGNRGWRIDHHYLTDGLYQRARRCWIDVRPRGLPKPSDHAPVVIELDESVGS